ncbi:hypothetical protein [Paenibacillus odorifer]|nr:hypothetical protein [Paenibacillus odorifer]MEC0132483.1 hypothetical protein [Paenibacillus odorifer]
MSLFCEFEPVESLSVSVGEEVAAGVVSAGVLDELTSGSEVAVTAV